MSDYLPMELRAELAQAQRRAKRKRTGRMVHIGDEAYPILELNELGLAVEVGRTPPLRGFIDIYDGARHLYQALIVASEREGDLMRYEFKRATHANTTAPVDFEQVENRPIALLTRN